MLLKDWIIEYFTIYEKLRLSSGTVRSYMTTLSRIPDWELEKVTRSDIQNLINSLSVTLSPSTVRHIYYIIAKSIKEAPFYGYFDNSKELIRIKLPPMKKKMVYSLSSEELERVKKSVLNSWYRDIFIILLNSGLRFSELAGLNCEDVNFKNKTIKIYKNYYRGHINYSAKTDSGIRTIPLNAEALGAIKRIYRIGGDALVCGKRGDRISYNTVVKEWHRICKESGIRVCGLHVFRHTFATGLLSCGVPLKVVSDLLGHSSIAITADIYTDVPLELKQNAVDSFGAYLVQ